MIAMLVALRPGNVLLIDVISRNSMSSNHFFRLTSASRRYATTPPPKLVAPITRNVMKISHAETFGRDVAGVVAALFWAALTRDLAGRSP